MRRHRNFLLGVLFCFGGLLAASEQARGQRLCGDFGMGNGGYAAGYSMTVGRWASRGWSLGGGWRGWGYGCGYRPWAYRPFGGWGCCPWAGGCGPRVCGGPGFWFGGPGFGFGGWAGSSTFFGSQSVYLAAPQGGGATFFSGAVVPYVVPYAVPYAVPCAVPYPVPWFGVRSGPAAAAVAVASRGGPAVATVRSAVRRPAPPPRIASLRGRQRARDLVARGDRILRDAAGDRVALDAAVENYRRATAAAADDPDIHIRHAIVLAAIGRREDADAAVSKATVLDGRLAVRPQGEPAAVVARGTAILRAIAAVGDGPLPGHLADVAAAWTGERAGPIVRLAAADVR